MSISRLALVSALTGLCLAWAPAAAQQGPGKTLVLIRDFDDALRLALALNHAVQLKRAGAEVRALFQDEGVLAVHHLPLPVEAGALPNDPGTDLFRERPFPMHDFNTDRAGKRPVGNRLGMVGKIKYAGKLDYPDVIINSAWAELKALEIPYEVSALSAKVYGLLGPLKAKGEPLTPDEDKVPDLSAYVKAGYRVVVF